MEKYSFSRVKLYSQCPFAFYKKYVLKDDDSESNAMASFGSLMHEIMQKVAEGSLTIFDIIEYYEFGFSIIPEKFPTIRGKNTQKTYFERGMEFLKNFQGFDDITVLKTEEYFSIEVDDFMFHGYIDLVYRDKDGKLIIRDYKSASSIQKKDIQEYARQLWLYAYAYEKIFNEKVDKVEFVLFSTGKAMSFDRDQAAIDEALSWLKDNVEAINNDFGYAYNNDFFFCKHLCEHRRNCEFN